MLEELMQEVTRPELSQESRDSAKQDIQDANGFLICTSTGPGNMNLTIKSFSVEEVASLLVAIQEEYPGAALRAREMLAGGHVSIEEVEGDKDE